MHSHYKIRNNRNRNNKRPCIFITVRLENVDCTMEILGVNYNRNIDTIQKGNNTRVVHLDKLKRAYLEDLPNFVTQGLKKIHFFRSSEGAPLKICSCNVASFRSIVKKTNIEYLLQEHADIFVLQELPCPTKNIPELAKRPNYHSYFVESATIGHNGVAI